MTWKHALFGAALVAGLVACGGSPTTPGTPNTPAPNVNACGAIAVSVSGATAITNGESCSGNTSVVRLRMLESDGFVAGTCSGTVIGPREILTAAHCLDGLVRTAVVWRGEFPPQEISTTSFRGHPGYNSSNNVAVDVGVVFVGQDLGRPAVPLLLSRDARVGETAVVAGWGRNAQDATTGFLRAGATTISAVDPGVIRTQFTTMTTGICSGDSGGPILLSEGGGWAIGGIISATSTATCNTGDHFYAAVRSSAIHSFILENVPNVTQR